MSRGVTARESEAVLEERCEIIARRQRGDERFFLSVPLSIVSSRQ